MSFEKWMKMQCPGYKKGVEESVLTRGLRMAYEAGKRQDRKDTEEIAKNAIKLREELAR